MTQPDPTQPLPKKSSWLNDLYESNKTLFDRLLVVLITAIVGGVFHVKLGTIEEQNGAIEKKADVAAKASEVAAKVSADTRTDVLKTEVDTKKLVNNTIGEKDDAKALTDAEVKLAAHQATTQAIAEQGK